MRTIPSALCAFLLLLAPFSATAAAPASPLVPKSPLPPIIIIPGAPATELIDRETGRRLWPSPLLMTFVKDGNHRLALPLDDPESTTIVPGRLLRSVRVAGIKFRITAYDGLEAGLRRLGYREGSWDAPAGMGEHYYFPYDWRLSVETNGRRFSRALADLYRRMPPGTPPAVVLSHSLGGLIARYALMYGDTPLGESGPLPPVTWAGGTHIGTLFLVATPNEGTFTALKYLETGTFYRWHRGAFSPATLFTFPSVFDMLPDRIEPLIDAAGRELPFRLDNPEDWERLGWSVVDPRHRSAIPHAALRAHLERELKRHARLHDALDQIAASPNPASLYVVGSLAQSSQRTAMVRRRGDRMSVRFAPFWERRALAPLLFEPGDTMITDRSLTAEGSAHDPASSLCFRSVLYSTRAHQALLSSPETVGALEEVVRRSGIATALDHRPLASGAADGDDAIRPNRHDE
jgi:hypothetical protein